MTTTLEPTLFQRARQFDRPTLSSIGFVAFLALCAVRLLSVDLGGIVTNDSFGYLGRAEDPFGAGFVFQGYRQAGYPLFIAFSDVLGELFGWDRIFGVALLQRTLLVGGLGLLAWTLRWWSAPVLIFATSSSFVVQADFVLTEGLLISGCVIAGALLAMATVGPTRSTRAAQTVLVAACVVGALCAAIKLQYAALLALAVAIAWLFHRDGLVSRRFGVVAIAAASMFVGVLVVAQSFENHSELGVFEPLAERHRSKWWGAWQVVFVHNDSNVSDPALAEYFDGGNLYLFLHNVELEIDDYDERRHVIEERTDAMFEAAGMSPRREQFNAFLGALRGGRSDDIGGIVERVLTAERGDPIVRVSPNQAFRNGGESAIIEGLNEGLRPGMVSTGPLFDFSQRLVDNYAVWRSRVGVVALVTMLAGLAFRGRHRPAVLSVLAVTLAIAAAMATGYTDNARYLLGSLVVAMIGSTLAVRGIATSSEMRSVIARWRSRFSPRIETADDDVTPTDARSPAAGGSP